MRCWGAVLAVLALTLAACDDMSASSYTSLADARNDGAISRGWIPSFLPEGTFEIREVHNLDTNETWGTFRFKPEEKTEVLRQLTNLIELDASHRRFRAPDVPWWPKSLQGPIDPSQMQRLGLEPYGWGPGSLLAIDSKENRAFFWHVPT